MIKLEIELINVEDCKRTRHIPYIEYREALEPHLQEIIKLIDDNNGQIYIKYDTIAKMLGEEFEKKKRATVVIGLRNILKEINIKVADATLKDNSPAVIFYRKKQKAIEDVHS